jgi:cation:H+ antiporter
LGISLVPAAALSSAPIAAVAPNLGLVAASLVIILLGAETFTNAVEWLGQKLGLGQGAIGSVLAAVGTALPETMIPIIAIVAGGDSDSHEIGIGAILGAPFLLSTAAFAVTGLGVVWFQGRRRSGGELQLDPLVIRRDIGFFFLVYLLAIAVSFIGEPAARYTCAAFLLLLYGLYVWRTFRHQDTATEFETEELNPLHIHRLRGAIGSPPLPLVLFQLILSLGLIIAGARVFVTNLEHLAHEFSVPALALALIIAPLATELPEKFNSVIWVRQGKDTLAMGNITGAMVFQSCIPVSIGLLFTEWHLSETAVVSAAVALASTGLVYLSIRRAGSLGAGVLARAGLFWLAFVVYVAVKIAVT